MALVQHSYGLKFRYEAVIAGGFPTRFGLEDPFQVGPFATLSSKHQARVRILLGRHLVTTQIVPSDNPSVRSAMADIVTMASILGWNIKLSPTQTPLIQPRRPWKSNDTARVDRLTPKFGCILCCTGDLPHSSA